MYIDNGKSTTQNSRKEVVANGRNIKERETVNGDLDLGKLLHIDNV
jgi:hypothetical protein